MHSFLKEALASDIRDGLVQLKSILIEDSPYLNTLIGLQSRERNVTTKKRKLIISPGDYEMEISKILDSALEIVDELKASDFVFTNLKKVNILIICRNEGDQKYMAHKMKRFKLQGIGKVEVRVIHTFFDSGDEYDLIVFDNRSLKPERDGKFIIYPAADDKKRLKLMKAWLNKTMALILHFGPTWQEMDKYRDQMHAANSIFALHARMKEMIHYIIDIKIHQTDFTENNS